MSRAAATLPFRVPLKLKNRRLPRGVRESTYRLSDSHMPARILTEGASGVWSTKVTGYYPVTQRWRIGASGSEAPGRG